MIDLGSGDRLTVRLVANQVILGELGQGLVLGPRRGRLRHTLRAHGVEGILVDALLASVVRPGRGDALL